MDENEFNSVLVESGYPALVLFTAPTWCVPCQRLEPHWSKAQQTEALSGFYFITVDMGGTPEDTGQHWATNKFGILGVPQIYLFTGPMDYKIVKSRAVVPLIRELVG